MAANALRTEGGSELADQLEGPQAFLDPAQLTGPHAEAVEYFADNLGQIVSSFGHLESAPIGRVSACKWAQVGLVPVKSVWKGGQSFRSGPHF